MIFAFVIGTAYAESMNGVTDFSGLTYDSLVVIPEESNSAMIESSGAGGLSDPIEGTSNGVTDFSGLTYDSLVVIPEESNDAMIEGSGAGGLHESIEGITNGVTDFSGGTYDAGAM